MLQPLQHLAIGTPPPKAGKEVFRCQCYDKKLCGGLECILIS